MSGGDTTALHNQIRDLIFDYCKRGGLHPVLEASHLLPGLDAARRRPADVLVQRPAPLLDRLPDGSMQSSHKPLALDFAVINALGPGHWDDTWRTPAGAAEAYSARKRQFHCTEQLCLQVGIQYRPIVLESHGGYSRAAASLLHRLADVVASAEGTDASVIRQRMFEQIAIAVARANARAIKRRRHCTTNAASSLSTQAELFVTPAA